MKSLQLAIALTTMILIYALMSVPVVALSDYFEIPSGVSKLLFVFGFVSGILTMAAFKRL